MAVHAWVPPGGEPAGRQHPSPLLQRMWQDAARQRLRAWSLRRRTPTVEQARHEWEGEKLSR